MPNEKNYPAAQNQPPAKISPNEPSPTVAGALKNGQAQIDKAAGK
jgi:hypothetical protein